ncbi:MULTISPECIES: DUF3892 domain-containing protein [unclassified Siphonobacter]|uniref:DUF3892 domain-containing protein n=1 Tax=unclassified Siphonobacter TaxID=2635712 RepID=UPI00278106A1|nr:MULTISPECIES: DUF3892 domain-containing protein [unclassified Siphonobacter]MDQ1085690.1 hypothetical protein [Siphonobacter sp. SORGH_AS_1065]MDR6195952.1 hypothetical protein [Siphonobacter sp. SORGH_AS_0500]
MSNRITHIRKPNVDSSVEHITHVKGTNSNGVFEYPVSTVIYYIKQGYEFYVQAGSEKAIVTYQKSAYGNEYIKTKPDSTRRDNLLSLPQF